MMFVIFLYQLKCTTANIVTLFDISSFCFINDIYNAINANKTKED